VQFFKPIGPRLSIDRNGPLITSSYIRRNDIYTISIAFSLITNIIKRISNAASVLIERLAVSLRTDFESRQILREPKVIICTFPLQNICVSVIFSSYPRTDDPLPNRDALGHVTFTGLIWLSCA
jgi:hypothetical protein